MGKHFTNNLRQSTLVRTCDLYLSTYLPIYTVKVLSTTPRDINAELGSQFLLKYKDKLATSIRDNRFREPIEFLYII